jgi:signal transduction histidine kinase
VDRLTVELSALAFQAIFTLLLALVYYALWRRQRRPYFATWAAAWALYALRLQFIGAYIVTRREPWLFAHQAATGLTALSLVFATLQFSRDLPWRRRYAWLATAAVAWAAIAIFGIRSMLVAGITAAVLLSGVTLWTGWVFWRHGLRTRSRGAALLAATFVLWGLHHLDYPLLRPLGTGVLYGVFADVLFITLAAIGILFLVLAEGRRALETRTGQLEQLTRLLLRSQEDERRRIARELHDEAGQVLTAVKIELDLDGRREASEMVGRALAQVRDISNLLRPAALDGLGLLPALRALTEDFARRTRIDVQFEGPDTAPVLEPEAQVAIYRVLQEALTNVARHAHARRVRARLESAAGRVLLTVEDDGVGFGGPLVPNLGLLGMSERVSALGGTLRVTGAGGAGVRVEACIPAESPANRAT